VIEHEAPCNAEEHVAVSRPDGPPVRCIPLRQCGPRAFRTVDDFGDANPRGHGKFHGRSRQPITLQNENPAGALDVGLPSPLLLRTNERGVHREFSFTVGSRGTGRYFLK
jgi:hypothetical protein